MEGLTPDLTPDERAVLRELTGEWQPGATVRARMPTHRQRGRLVKFYFTLSRLEGAGLAERHFVPGRIGGVDVKRFIYRLTARGRQVAEGMG